MSRPTGTLSQWDDAKGYGFITPDAGGSKVFVHVKAFGMRPHRPFVGERLSYREGTDAQGKRRAQSVQALVKRGAAAPAAARRTGSGSGHGSGVLLLVPGFAALVLACHLIWGLPNWTWGLYSALSTATFIVYALDKRAVARGEWRVAENTLHLLAVAGGWPGALLAQQTLRHKSAKPAFRRVFWLTVVVNVAAFVAAFTPWFRS